MLFSSSVFLFAFLPITLLIYYGLLRGLRRGQNVFLLVASLFFYGWGSPVFLVVMMGSILANYLLGLWVDHEQSRGAKPTLPVVTALAVNLGVLFIFKYLTFTLANLRGLGLPLMVPVLELPLGISFFTFQALSYVLDIARGEAKVQKDPLHVGLYIAFFPQLIAGPIVKYQTVANQIINRHENWTDFSAGVYRFLMGLGKKILISNQLAVVVDAAFATSNNSVTFAWLGGICYTMQVYYDFSGYSDMAIGLGKMFGFQFRENFRYPFIAHSSTDFWKRWHISLTSWFRDYLYIPLGGSRMKTKWGVLRNIFLVWIFTGIWHGANWTFLVWGMINFLLIMGERLGDLPNRMPKWMGWCYAQVGFMLSMVVFRSNSLADAGAYFVDLFKLDTPEIWSAQTGYYLQQYGFFILMGVLCAGPTATWLRSRLSALAKERGNPLLMRGWDVCCALAMVAMFFVAAAFLIKGTYNPFIYFNF